MNPEDQLSWTKWVFFKNGISPREFRKQTMKDIHDIVEIEEAIQRRGIAWNQIKAAMRKAKW